MPDLHREERVGDEVVEFERVARDYGGDMALAQGRRRHHAASRRRAVPPHALAVPIDMQAAPPGFPPSD